MNSYIRVLVFLLLLSVRVCIGGEAPKWVLDQIVDGSVLYTPGAYPLDNGKILGVGRGRLHDSLRDKRAAGLALDTAEHDAKRHIARHLFPEVFKNHDQVSFEFRHVNRIYEKPASPDDQYTYVGVVANKEDVIRVPLADASVIQDATKVAVAPDMLAYLEDPLLQLGGGRIFSYKNGWLVVGVGVAPLFGTDSVAERDAIKRARIDAEKNVTETVFGSDFEVLEREAETASERDGIVNIRQWIQKGTRESVEGELKQVKEVGHWFTIDDHVALVVAISNPSLDQSFIVVQPEIADDAEIPEYPEWDVEPYWEQVLLTHRHLLQGGAILHSGSSGIWIVGVGGARLNGNPANDQINAPRAAEIDARRNITKYLTGFALKSRVEAIEEITIAISGNDAKSTVIADTIQKLTREKVAGMVVSMRKGGSWKSIDGKLLFQVHFMPI